jgi:hypothetical protein
MIRGLCGLCKLKFVIRSGQEVFSLAEIENYWASFFGIDILVKD